jgi:hypothetical protein
MICGLFEHVALRAKMGAKGSFRGRDGRHEQASQARRRLDLLERNPGIGTRPPTEAITLACDAALPERKGWFSEYYENPATGRRFPRPAIMARIRGQGRHPARLVALHRHRAPADRGLRRSLLATLTGASEETVSAPGAQPSCCSNHAARPRR